MKIQFDKFTDLLSLPEKDILDLIDIINIKAKTYLDNYRKRRAEKNNYRRFHPYRWLRRSNIWEEGKLLNMVLNIKRFGELTCEYCNSKIIGKKCSLHHLKYDDSNCFGSDVVWIVHGFCHEVIHGK